jgi:4-amino-4-deoxy-L-arabinose transferase-like glycosyltransferase
MELRWTEIPREMQRSGDYFRPTINGRLYYDKPLGSYWLVLAAGWLTGTVDERTARLPSAVCGLIGVALLMHLAAQLYGRRTAALAGLILATSFAYLFFAQHASADMETVTGELAALVVFRRIERRPSAGGVIGLWLIMALTSLTKGLLGFVLPLLVIATASTLAPSADPVTRGTLGRLAALVRRNRLLLSRASAVGAVVAAVVYLVPFAVSGRDAGQGLSLVFRENIQRFIAPHNHRGPVYLYAYVVFGLLAPWSVFLPAALIQLPSRRSADGQNTGDRFTLIYFWTTFLFFTLSASRRSYYLLPILPAGALLVARLLTKPASALTVSARRLLYLGFGVLVVTVVGAGIALLPPAVVLPGRWATLPAAPERVTLALGWVVCLVGVGYACRRLQPSRIALAAGLVASLGMAYVYGVALPATEPYRGERAFAAAVRERVGPDPNGLALCRTRELVYYLDYPEPLAEYNTPAELRAAAADGRVQWVILRRRDLDRLGLPVEVRAEETAYPWDDDAAHEAKAVLLRVTGRP